MEHYWMAGEIELFISYIFISEKSNQQMIKVVTDYLFS